MYVMRLDLSPGLEASQNQHLVDESQDCLLNRMPHIRCVILLSLIVDRNT